MSCTNFQRTISLHKNVKYQSVILTIIEGDFQLVFENIELDTLVIKPINGWEYYEGIIPFNQGLAAIKHDGKWGYVNSKFDIVVPLKYDSCEIARKGLLKVYLMKRNAITVESYITRNDSIVWQRVKDKNETINNIYSKKEKMKYGTWIYKYEDTKWTKHMLIIIIIVGCLFFIVFKTHKRNNFIDSIKTNKKEIKL